MDIGSRRIAGKRILYGVTGGIAAYRALDVIGRLQDEGAETPLVLLDRPNDRGAHELLGLSLALGDLL